MTEVQIPVQVHNGHPGMSIRRSSGPKSVCQCCPYGYHIDLDFVRFCEMLSKNNSEPSPSKRQRRERRRQRQSMEILLGLAGPVLLGLEQQFLPTVCVPPVLLFIFCCAIQITLIEAADCRSNRKVLRRAASRRRLRRGRPR